MADRDAILDALRERLAGESSRPVGEILEGLRAEDIAVLMRDLADREVFDAWEALHAEDPELAVEVLPLLDRHDVSRVVDEMPDERVADVLEEMPSDDATYVLGLMDEDRVEPIVAAMEPEERAEVRERLEYPEGSAGRLMSDEYLALPVTATAGEAVRRLQEAAEDVTIVYVYLVDEQRRLRGVVSLRTLLRVKPERPLVDVSPSDVIRVKVSDDQEHVAQVVASHDLVAVPVVDDQDRLVGVVTHDDVMDVLREEATEDMLAMAGTSSEDVIAQSVWSSVRLRIPWLVLALAGELVAMKVLHVSERRLGDVFLALALFMPAIVAMGGNVGTQAATIVVRGLATGRVQRHDTLPVLWRELRTACAMSLLLGGLSAAAALLVLGESPRFASVVGLGIVASMGLAATLGTLVPIVFAALGVDPAVATGPLVTTSMDVIGIGGYLALAAWLLTG